MKLSDYLTKMGHGSGTALALFLGVAQSNVSDWATGKKLTPAGRCRAIEHWTSGEVTVMELRPDDWKEYWPERDQAHATPAQPAINAVAQAIVHPATGNLA